MGCWQCLPLGVVQLKGEHCTKPHCHNDVVDTFGHSKSILAGEIYTSKKFKSVAPTLIMGFVMGLCISISKCNRTLLIIMGFTNATGKVFRIDIFYKIKPIIKFSNLTQEDKSHKCTILTTPRVKLISVFYFVTFQ